MWWRLGMLAAVSLGLLVLLFMPVQTVDIVVELPPARGGRSMSADQMETVTTGITTAITLLFLVGYAALVLWIGRRIVRRYGRKA